LTEIEKTLVSSVGRLQVFYFTQSQL